MTKLLLKLFVKDYDNTNDDKVRKRYGSLSAVVCIVLNTLLAVGKIVVGVLFGAISVLADGLNNLSDCGSNVVTLVSFKMAGKPADKEHPFGHQRVEYVASMIVAFLILIVAFELAVSSVEKIFVPTKTEFSVLSVVVLSVALLVKLWMGVFNSKLAKAVSSDVLKATATDSFSDCISTSVVLVSLLVSYFCGIELDGIMGVAVSVLIALAGIGILKDTMSKLLGKAPDKELIEDIKSRIFKYDGIYGVHDLTVHSYGDRKYFASVHCEVDSTVPVLESHDVIDRIERDFAENTNVEMVIHLDPIVLDDEETNTLRVKVEQYVNSLDSRFHSHDFRVVKGVTHTNLIFDVAIPFDTKQTDQHIKNAIVDEIRSWQGNYYAVVTVEKQLS